LISQIKRIEYYRKLISERTVPKISVKELPKRNFYNKLGYLPLKFLSVLKMSGVLKPGQRVFFILDEYDQCEFAGRRQFAYAINSFVKDIARGSFPDIPEVSVKIGSRNSGFVTPHKVLGGNAMIEEDRDYKKIDLSILRKNNTLFSGLLKILQTDV